MMGSFGEQGVSCRFDYPKYERATIWPLKPGTQAVHLLLYLDQCYTFGLHLVITMLVGAKNAFGCLFFHQAFHNSGIN